jgi:2Fe-2S ferredoxin
MISENKDVSITVIDRQNEAHQIAAPVDMNLNLMEVCKLYELPVKGECGGMAMCATCQVYVESEHVLPEKKDAELDMLDQAFFVKSNSRLGCQIHITPELEGLVVRLAPESE